VCELVWCNECTAHQGFGKIFALWRPLCNIHPAIPHCQGHSVPQFMASSLILLVEDDTNDMFLIRRAFKKADANRHVFGVWDGKQAISYLSGTDEFASRDLYPLPTLLLLDLKLPRVSGLDVLAWLKGESSLKRMIVVVLSASSQNADIARAYDLGANSYLVKPLASNQLDEMIRAVNSFWLVFNADPQIPLAASRFAQALNPARGHYAHSSDDAAGR